MLPKRKAETISVGVLLIAIGIIFYFNTWWPGILLAIWAFLATRQVLTGRHFDFLVSTVILVGAFVLSVVHIDWNSLGPLLFILGGLYIVFKEYFFDVDGDPRYKTKEIDETDPYSKDK